MSEVLQLIPRLVHWWLLRGGRNWQNFFTFASHLANGSLALLSTGHRGTHRAVIPAEMRCIGMLHLARRAAAAPAAPAASNS